MIDTLTKEHRSWVMSRVKSTGTKPELRVRSLLHRLGYRFRLHSKKLPGTPDIVLKKYRTVIYVNGCFWHGHENCKKSRLPKTNLEFWRQKVDKNKQRDKKNQRLTKIQGWIPLIVWECELSNMEKLTKRLIKKLAESGDKNHIS